MSGPNTITPVVSFDDPRSRTLGEFCNIERMSLSSFYELKRHDMAPEVTHPPGTKIHRITHEAHAKWRQRMAELAQSEDAALERERRRQQAQEAGKRAAELRAAG